MSILQSSEGSSISGKSEHPKVPIPRLGKSKADQDISYHGKIERRRVTHACEPCREKKTKCDGGSRPMCYHCRISGIACYYGDGKRERARKNLRALENRIVDLEGLIQEIQPYLSNTGKLLVNEILAQNPVPSPPNNHSPGQVSTSNDTTSNYRFSRRDSTNSLSQSFMSTDLGSVSPVGRQVKDVHTEFIISRGERVEGDSNPVWVCRGDERFENDANNAPTRNLDLVPSYRTTGASAGCMRARTSIQRDTQDLSIGDRETQSHSRQVDTFSLPPRPVAGRLVDLYFTTVHPLFPIICKSHFIMQFNEYYGSLENSLEPIAHQNSREWLTILNLVFAIAEKYLQPEVGMNARGQGDTDYFARSRILGALDGGSVFQIPDLGKIQALGLTGMYLLASIQTNRAWNVAGLAIRLAHGIGLHLRGDSVSGDLEEKMRARIWYCLYCLETTLCLITGRPCAIQNRICSAPYPSALNDEILPAQYSDIGVLDAYFSKHQTLMAISADMLLILYSEKSFRYKSWSQVQDLIMGLSKSLQNWRIQLPLVLDFFKEETDMVFRRQRLNLAFQYYTILMLTNRPCLPKISSRKDNTPNGSSEFGEFRKTSAETCINSARAIIHLIVKEYRIQDLIPNSPWWCLIHHLIPANKIIMLEVAGGNLHTSEYRAALLEDCKMVIVWLRSMAKVNAILQRYGLELLDQLKQVAPGIDTQQLGEEIMESGPQEATTQSSSSSTEYTASTLPQATGFGDMRLDIYGKTCCTAEYQYFDSTSTN